MDESHERVTFKRSVVDMGGSLQINIPKEVAIYLELKKGDEILLSAEMTKIIDGKYGKFASFWKNTQEEE